MVALPASSLTAGLLTLEFAAFSLVLGLTRASTNILFGSGGQKDNPKRDLTALIRAQANVGEYGAYLILAFVLTEYNNLLSTSVLTLVGIITVLLRLAHGVQLANRDTVPLPFRQLSFLATIGILSWLAALNVFYGLSGRSSSKSSPSGGFLAV